MTETYFNLEIVNEKIQQVIEDSWSSESDLTYLNALAEGVQKLSGTFISLGDECENHLFERGKEDRFFPLYIHFQWVERAKSFLILWRDILFEAQKAYILTKEGRLPQDKFSLLKESSRNTVLSAHTQWKKEWEKALGNEDVPSLESAKQIYKWKLQRNPYEVYRKHFTALTKQCVNLIEQHSLLILLSSKLNKIKQLVLGSTEACVLEIQQAKDLSESALRIIGINVEEKLNRIPALLDDLENSVNKFQPSELYNVQLNGLVRDLETRLRIPVNVRDGLLLDKEINFQRSTNLWLDSEILPMLYEVWELAEQTNLKLKMTLFNVRNRAILLSNEQKSDTGQVVSEEDLTQPIMSFLKLLAQTVHDQDLLIHAIRDRIETSFGLFSIYDQEQAFLPLSQQQTINQLKSHQNRWLEKFTIWRKKKWTAIQNFTNSVQVEESLSTSEKIVRMVRINQVPADNYQYSSIFLTKGYIGESFWVKRPLEMNHLESLIQQWREGFRGAVILSGKRSSGKSLFGETAAHRFFPKNTIRLQPNSVIRIQGRQFKCTTDLNNAIEFIKKYSHQERVLVWIDDLEKWNDTTCNLSYNSRKLFNHIDSHSRQIFFMVSMGTWLKQHLNRIHDINRRFQAEINLDRMNLQQVREAILIRHGATHKHLVNEEGEELSPAKFNRISAAIHRKTEGNIGEALNVWSFSTHKFDEEKVVYQAIPDHSLPNFLNTDTGIVLRTFLLEKKTSEYLLRKKFGPAFKGNYSNVVERLLGVGLLQRLPDGSIELNHTLANDIGKKLEEMQFLINQRKA